MRSMVILDVQWRAYRLPFVGYLSPRQDSRFIAPKADACHPERSEGSGSMGGEILRCAQDDSRNLRKRTCLSKHAFCLDIGRASLNKPEPMVETYGRDTERDIKDDGWVTKFVQALHSFYR